MADTGGPSQARVLAGRATRSQAVATVTRSGTVTRLPSSGRQAWDHHVDGWLIHLAAGGKSPHTLRAYGGALDRFRRFLEDTGRPLDPAAVTRRDLEAFQVDLREGARPATPGTQAQRVVVLKAFFTFLASEEEGIIAKSPADRIRPARQPRGVAVPVVGADDLRKLLAATAGRTFASRRDRALILLLVASGIRRGEAAGILVEDLDLRDMSAVVFGKTGRRRVRFGPQATDAIRQYLNVRDDHPEALHLFQVGSFAGEARVGLPLFLATPTRGNRGYLSGAGIAAMLLTRCREARIGPIHPHQFRHTWAAAIQASGIQDGAIMTLAGWTGREMLDRYGRDTAAQRAAIAYRDPTDRILRGR
jgi:site-specific recombinase XerD